MTIESILRRKGTSVTTIAPEASIKRAADWLRAKNIGALVVTSEDTVLGLIRLEDLELETNVLRDVYNAAR
jgi:CBS domain-containing protein